MVGKGGVNCGHRNDTCDVTRWEKEGKKDGVMDIFLVLFISHCLEIKAFVCNFSLMLCYKHHGKLLPCGLKDTRTKTQEAVRQKTEEHRVPMLTL